MTNGKTSSTRTKSAARKRALFIACAADVLRANKGMMGFSVEAVARAAGVTRLTVYNHFGSRRCLLEGLMGDMSAKGGIRRIEELPAEPDAWAALDRLVEIFMTFWASDNALAYLTDAAETDPDLSEALEAEYALGKKIIDSVVARLLPDALLHQVHEIRDMIRALILYPTYRTLAVGRSTEQVIALVQPMCRYAVESAEHSSSCPPGNTR